MNEFLNEEAQDFMYYLWGTPIVRLAFFLMVAMAVIGFVRFSRKQEHKPWEILKGKINKLAPFCFGLQVAVVLFFLVKLFAPMTTIQIPFTEFSRVEADFHSVEDGYLLFENHEGLAPTTSVFSQEYELPAGAYDVTIRYESMELEEYKGHLSNSTGWISLYSSGSKREVTFDELKLRDSETVLSSRLWTGDLFPVDDLIAEITYAGYGIMKIEEIVLEEASEYRFILLMKYVLLFALVDILYYYFIKKENAITTKGKYLLFLLGSSFMVSFPMTFDFVFYGDDFPFHLSRIASLGVELNYGQFPVRILTEMLNGYSYTTPLFYCDLFLYIPGLLYYFMVPLQKCYQIYIFLVHFSTAIIGYYCFSIIAKDKNIGLVVSILYTTSHYRLLCAYTRSAVGEFTAVMFLPLVALGIYLIYTEEKPKFKHWCYLSFGMAGIVSSHVILLFLAALALALFCLFFWKKTFEKPRFMALVKATITTISLCLWFIVPFMESYTMPIRVKQSVFFDIQGSGVSMVNILKNAILPVGWSLTLGSGLFIVLISGGLLLWKGKPTRNFDKVDSDSEYLYFLLKIMIAFSLLTLFFCLNIYPIKEIFELFGEGVASLFGKIQFTWRWLSISTIFSCVAAVFVLRIIQKRYNRYFQKFVGLLVLCTISSSAVYTIHFAINGIHYAFNSIETLQGMSKGNIGLGEYLLDGLDFDFFVYRDVGSTDEEVLLHYEKVEGVGQMIVENQSNEPQEVIFPVQKYDNYVVRDESGLVFPVGGDGNYFVTVEVPANFQGTLMITYEPPLYWRGAELVSLLTFCWVCVLMKKNEMISVPDLRKLKKWSLEGEKEEN